MLTEALQRDLVLAMKEKQAVRLGVLRMTKSALKNQEIALGHALSDAEAMAVLTRLVKQRRESIEQFERGGRQDLADVEKAELEILEAYLPQAPTQAELEAAVQAAVASTGASSPRDMGRVIKEAQGLLTGRQVDGKALSTLVRDVLAAL